MGKILNKVFIFFLNIFIFILGFFIFIFFIFPMFFKLKKDTCLFLISKKQRVVFYIDIDTEKNKTYFNAFNVPKDININDERQLIFYLQVLPDKFLYIEDEIDNFSVINKKTLKHILHEYFLYSLRKKITELPYFYKLYFFVKNSKILLIKQPIRHKNANTKDFYSITIVNATNINGLASKFAKIMENSGFSVNKVDNLDFDKDLLFQQFGFDVNKDQEVFNHTYCILNNDNIDEEFKKTLINVLSIFNISFKNNLEFFKKNYQLSDVVIILGIKDFDFEISK